MDGKRERAPLRYCDGDRINDRYQISCVLGGGGYSVVYEAYDEYLDEVIALKIFAPNYGFDPVRREIQALRRLNHPNVVQVIDVGLIDSDPQQWYMKLELLKGPTLRQTLDDSGPLTAPDVAIVGRQLLTALCEIHPNGRRIAALKQKGELSIEEYAELQTLQSSGLLHRDIKPENILHAADSIKLIDFNLATPVGAPVDTRSHTPDYSPSLLALERWDVHPDIHAAAVTLFELLEGRKPDRQTVDSMKRQPERLHGPRGFVEFIERSLDHGGFATASDMLDAFEALQWDEAPTSNRRSLDTDDSRDESVLLRFKPGAIVSGLITSVTGFGAFVDLDGTEGLIHVSQISWAYVRSPHDVLAVGDEVEAVVLEADDARSRVALSMKELQPDPWIEFALADEGGRHPKGCRGQSRSVRRICFTLRGCPRAGARE